MITEQQNTATRKIATSRFGEIEVDTDKIINLTSPILGFPDERRFVLLPHGKDSAFLWFQSTENPGLAFVVIHPIIIKADYQPTFPGHIQTELDISDANELETLVMLTIPKDHPEKMTANLLGPIVFNSKKRLARQVLLDPNNYDACWPILENQKDR